MWKTAISSVLLLVFATLSTLAVAQTAGSYPTRPVRIILPYAPGGSASVLARALSDGLTKELGQSFIVDNRAGGGSVIGTEDVARATADGYTLLLISTTIAINQWTHSNLRYDTLKDLVGVSTVVRQPHMMAIHPSVPVNNLDELITYLKKNPGKLNAYSSGPGNSGQLVNLRFMSLTGTKYTMVPYKGGGSFIADFLAGELQLALNTPSLFAPHIKAGKLRGIAIASTTRSPVLPDLPTFAESGLKDFVVGNWYMLLAPSSTPQAVVDKLNAATSRVLANTETQDYLAKQAIDTFPNSVAATNALLRSELEKYGKVVKDNNIKAEAE